MESIIGDKTRRLRTRLGISADGVRRELLGFLQASSKMTFAIRAHAFDGREAASLTALGQDVVRFRCLGGGVLNNLACHSHICPLTSHPYEAGTERAGISPDQARRWGYPGFAHYRRMYTISTFGKHIFHHFQKRTANGNADRPRAEGPRTTRCEACASHAPSFRADGTRPR